MREAHISDACRILTYLFKERSIPTSRWRGSFLWVQFGSQIAVWIDDHEQGRICRGGCRGSSPLPWSRPWSPPPSHPMNFAAIDKREGGAGAQNRRRLKKSSSWARGAVFVKSWDALVGCLYEAAK
jgi:hypothetical protein